MKILIIEDSIRFASFYIKLIEMEFSGWEYKVISSVKEWHQQKKRDYDFVISDMQLIGENSIEILDDLDCKNVIIISGYLQKEEYQECFKRNNIPPKKQYDKPINLQRLIRIFHEAENQV